VTGRTYPADPADAALRLFRRWFGGHYARTTVVESMESQDSTLTGVVTVGRRWRVSFTVVNTLAPDADLAFEAARAALEQRLDSEGRSLALWVPRGAQLPTGEPGLSQVVLSVQSANQLEDGRLEVRRPANIYLRRTSTQGSVVTILGGLAAHWAQFTNRVPGSFQLQAQELYRLPASEEERELLTERIVLASQQPEADDSQLLTTEDVWTANDLEDGGSCVLGTPIPENDEWSSSLRRNLRLALRAAKGFDAGAVDARALIVLGAADYAEEEKLTLALRGMDPGLYAGYDLISVIADGVVKPLLQPARQTLPWDAPLG
jgi:hypothetical protein